MKDSSPKTFISYSWSSPAHEKWVEKLATELRDSGVDVILDKWDLKKGHDAIAFMEKMVTDDEVKKVILVCDKEYVEKANKRKGGVGTEAQIVSPKIYKKVDQDKFVAVIAERDDDVEPCVPVFYQGRIHIDISDDGLYAANFDELLRWIYDKPLHVKPSLGKKPAFLAEDDPIALGTTAQFRRALDAIRNQKAHGKGALDEYFDTFIENVEEFRIEKTENESFDDQVIENIEKFIPYRNELIQLFITIAEYGDTDESREQVHHFFERLIPYLDRPEGVSSWQDWDFDNFKFIIQELYLYLIAVLARYGRFEFLGYMLRQQYYVERTPQGGPAHIMPFSNFRNHLQSLRHRNERLKLGRASLHADLLQQRCKGLGITFEQLMQGDLILYVRDCLDALRKEVPQLWWPETLLYAGEHHGPFEIFARSRSREYFDSVKRAFDINSVQDLKSLMVSFKNGKLEAPRWTFTSLDIGDLINIENIEKDP